METRSIFSTNTFKTTQTSGQPLNQNTHHHFHHQTNLLHSYLINHIAPNTARQYPYLSKLFYLQILLKQNILIFTKDRIAARQILTELTKNLNDKTIDKQNIFIIDERFDVNRILKNKNQLSFLLYDVHKLNTNSVNAFINHFAKFESESPDKRNQFSFIGICDEDQEVSPHIVDLFSMVFHYQPELEISKFIQTIQSQSKYSLHPSKFSRSAFNDWLKQNYETVILQNDEEGFLKPFLSLFDMISKKQYLEELNIPHSKWKKTFKILKYLGVNRNEGVYKKMGLTDLLFLPETLPSTLKQYHIIKQIVKKSMFQFVPLYGRQKFCRMLKSHYWISQKTKAEYENLSELCSISFFYPCTKFPSTALIKLMDEQLCYNIVGNQKKLMSDHHYPLDQMPIEKNPENTLKNIEISTKNKYLLEVDLFSFDQISIHIGINCYDHHKNQILPIQVCRVEGSQVKFNRIQENWLYVENNEGLKKWANPSEQNFNYLKAIGVYKTGGTEPYPEMQNILYNKQSPFSKNKSDSKTYFEIDIENSRILLSEEAKNWFISHIYTRVGPEITLMNHYEGGSFCISQTINFTNSPSQVPMQQENNRKQVPVGKWQHLSLSLADLKYGNRGDNFLFGTDFIRVTLVSEGQHKQDGKPRQFCFRNVQWTKK